MNSLEKKLIVAISAVVLMMIAAGIIAFKALNYSIEISKQVSNTRETLTEVESTLLTLKDAEADQREYIASGKHDALEHFNSIREESRRKIGRLKVLTANNAGHQERLIRLEPAIHKKLGRMHETIDLRKNEELSTAKETALADEENQQVDNINKLLGDIKAEENEALQRRIALSEQSVRNVTISFGSLFILILALLFLVYFLVKKDIVTQKQLQERLNELASVDELTTLYNRREINRCFKDEVERFRRFKQPFALLMLDIDHFKSVNDNYGHPTGDKVLKYVSGKIRDGIRSIDVPGRFGGEEFAIILPNTNSNDAFVIAERLRQKIADEPFKLEQSNNQIQEIPITVSIGISVIETDESEEDVLRTADNALYNAKNEGRNRTVTFDHVKVFQ